MSPGGLSPHPGGVRRPRPPAWPCRAGLPTAHTIGPNFVPVGGIYKPTAVQRPVADVIDVPEEAADSLDAALHWAEDEGRPWPAHPAALH